MTSLLTDFNPIALDIAHSGGMAWVCISSGCGETKVLPQSVPPSTQFPFYLSKTEEAFDGVYFVGEVTASKPAVE
jgi:hypothetical protein